MLRSHTVRTLAAFGVVLMLAGTVAGCGRRGRLEPPPDPSAPPPNTASNKTGLHKRPKNPPILPPSDPFILDPILK